MAKDDDIIKQIIHVLETMGKEAADALVSALKGPLREKAGKSLERYRTGDFGDANKQSVQSGAEGSVRPTVQTDRSSFAGGIPVTQEGRSSEAILPETFASRTAVSTSEKDVRNVDMALVHSNQYAGEYGSDARVQAVFRTKDGFMSDSLISDLGPQMLKEKYLAATGEEFTGSDKDLVKKIIELRDKASSAPSK